MYKKITASLVFGCLTIIVVMSEAALAQNISVTGSVDAATLRTTLVGGGSTINVISEANNGNSAAFGTFSGGNSSFGITSGIIISTGTAANAANSSSVFLSTQFSGSQITGTELNNISNLTLFDRAAFTLSFVPSGNRVFFRYRFCTEEVFNASSSVADVMGIFVNGIAAENNVATLPNGAAVTVASIAAGNFYQTNTSNELGNAFGGSANNGCSILLNAEAGVNIGQTNQLIISVADAGDAIYDSALFLEEASLVSNNSPVLVNSLNDQTAYQDYPFSFQIPENTFSDPDTSDVLTYSATLSDGSPIPAWLTFTPGNRTFTGTPAASDVGSIAVRVTVTDMYAASASDDFNIEVSASIPPTPTAIPTNTPIVDKCPLRAPKVRVHGDKAIVNFSRRAKGYRDYVAFARLDGSTAKQRDYLAKTTPFIMNRLRRGTWHVRYVRIHPNGKRICSKTTTFVIRKNKA